MQDLAASDTASNPPRQVRSIRDADVAAKRVLVRADLNVPLENGRIADDTRIRASLPTLELLRAGGAASITVCSHLGRPNGNDPSLSMKPVEIRLRELFTGPLTVLENTRFDSGETSNDPAFARDAGRRQRSVCPGRLRLGSPRARLDRRRRPTAPDLRGSAARKRARAPRATSGSRRTTVRARLRRRQGRRQARRPSTSRRSRGHRSRRREDGRATARGQPTRVPGRASRRRCRRRSLRRRGGRAHLHRRGAPLWLDRARHRPPDPRAVHRRARYRPDDLLERPDGRLRMATVRRRHEGGGRSRRRRGCLLGRRGADSLRALNELGLAHEVSWASTGGGASLELLEGNELPGIAVIPSATTP